MANFISNFMTNFTNRIAQAVADRVMTDSGKTIANARAYRLGVQPKPIKTKPNQYDDNLILNYTGLIVDRSVSQLIGEGIEFDFEGETETPQEEYIDAVWDANHQEILLHRAALSASEAGTGYIMLNPPSSGIVGEDAITYPRLVLVDPAYMTMETLPEDFEIVYKYIIQYTFTDFDGKEAARRKTIVQDADSGKWIITDEIQKGTGGKWVLVASDPWPYDFCPVVHWQNLPTIDSPYGEPDITGGLMEVQDKINADISFLSKSLRLGSDPLRVFTGSMAPEFIDTIKSIHVPDGSVTQLPPATDWPGELAYLQQVSQAMFKIARTVDVASLEDKLGSLTNFALKVIYQDNAAKINTKRELFGDALEEINRRLMLMAGMEPIDCDVIWPDFMPTNQAEEAAYYQGLQALGVISKQTLADKLGIDWEKEQERMKAEQEADRQANDNVGAFLLRQQMRGEGGQMPNIAQEENESSMPRGNAGHPGGRGIT
jgi:hypothetical protein